MGEYLMARRQRYGRAQLGIAAAILFLGAELGLAQVSVGELQADEIRTIVGSKEHPIWIFHHD
jgi:hypothetical protein